MKLLTPRQQNFSNILINSLWSFISWVIWSIIIIIITFIMSNLFNVVWMFWDSSIGIKISPAFPFIFSLITLLWVTISSLLTYKILNMTDPEKYKKNSVIFWQLSFFQIIWYIMMIPLYIYTWKNNFDMIMYVFTFHILLIGFWINIILEIFNNYRYILLGLYWTIIWLFFSILFCFFIFSTFSAWYSKITILISLLPFSNFIITFFKQLFELVYSMYYRFTTLDPMWDIFYQIEVEEEEKLREEEEKNTI